QRAGAAHALRQLRAGRAGGRGAHRHAKRRDGADSGEGGWGTVEAEGGWWTVEHVTLRYACRLPSTIHQPPSLFTASPSDRKSTRLNSSHVKISYAVFCLK